MDTLRVCTHKHTSHPGCEPPCLVPWVAAFILPMQNAFSSLCFPEPQEASRVTDSSILTQAYSEESSILFSLYPELALETSSVASYIPVTISVT